MKTLTILLIALSLVSCDKIEGSRYEERPAVDTVIHVFKKSGTVMFYLPDIGANNTQYSSGVAVVLDSVTIGTITNIPIGVPDCGSWWGLTVSKNVGIYSYFATTLSGSKTWSGQIEIRENECVKIAL
jgi:hypothetical protein